MVLRIGNKASFLMAGQPARPSSGDWLRALLLSSGYAGYISYRRVCRQRRILAQARGHNSVTHLSMFLDSAINCFKWQADYGNTEFTAFP